MDNTASQGDSIIYGIGNTVAGINSMAGGRDCHVNGIDAFALGEGTISNYKTQYALGRYNIADTTEGNTDDPGTYIEIIGNGSSDSHRSNARTLDWEGNEWLAGGLTTQNLIINNNLIFPSKTAANITSRYLFSCNDSYHNLYLNAVIEESNLSAITTGIKTLLFYKPNENLLEIGASNNDYTESITNLYLRAKLDISLGSETGEIISASNFKIYKKNLIMIDDDNTVVTLTAAQLQAIKTACNIT